MDYKVTLEHDSVAMANDVAEATITLHTGSDGSRLTVYKILLGSDKSPAAWLVSLDDHGGPELAALLRRSVIQQEPGHLPEEDERDYPDDAE